MGLVSHGGTLHHEYQYTGKLRGPYSPPFETNPENLVVSFTTRYSRVFIYNRDLLGFLFFVVVRLKSYAIYLYLKI